MGTPLTIDEATQQRIFGLFARMLVDVDLSDEFFESVVIIREGHVLSIQVQYENQPSFYANCKMFGHTLQNCMKLSSNNKQDAPSKHVKKVPTVKWIPKKQNLSDLSGTQPMQNSINYFDKVTQ